MLGFDPVASEPLTTISSTAGSLFASKAEIRLHTGGTKPWFIQSMSGAAELTLGSVVELNITMPLYGEAVVALSTEIVLTTFYGVGGVITQGTDPAQSTVRVYRRDTGAMLAETGTDSEGYYFVGLGGFTGEVDVVALGPVAARPLVHGPLTPAPQ